MGHSKLTDQHKERRRELRLKRERGEWMQSSESNELRLLELLLDMGFERKEEELQKSFKLCESLGELVAEMRDVIEDHLACGISDPDGRDWGLCRKADALLQDRPARV